ncbi:RNA polymerase sigma factor CnrH [Roseimaritima multifibrata]|uniref:RNA polymerase sigma factor CnrH n=1 Tax=Roseimaritima multifibrata TaxID=1930274 RepID=A0A517ME95_9BACT|nr:sigma-70 family RNA polymerase sigma factor [Roseimaritima multifibrata]QDS93097.1 RNA polymerase sigma factor CnrH [Roseimaritima multifibrata]
MTASLWPQADGTETLLAAARTGDEEAINQLFDRHRDPVRRLVRMRLDRRVQQRVDVSDVVQEVMLEANGRLQNYLENPVMAFHLWIRQIAWDRMIDTYRKHRGSAKRDLDREQPLYLGGDAEKSTLELAAALQDPQLTPQAIAVQRELASQVNAGIEKLDEQDREVLWMRHFEHLTNQEVASALGISDPAASMRYLRAIRRLREQLRDDKDLSTS